LARAAYELDAFKPNLTRAEADLRIAMLSAKLKPLDGPPHVLCGVPMSITRMSGAALGGIATLVFHLAAVEAHAMDRGRTRLLVNGVD